MSMLPTDSSATSPSATAQSFEELKGRVHRQLLERLDLVALGSLASAQAEDQVRSALQRLLEAESLPLSGVDREKLIEEVGYEVVGFGPLDPLLRDGEITDILVNGHAQVYIEKQGRLSLTHITFRYQP